MNKLFRGVIAVGVLLGMGLSAAALCSAAADVTPSITVSPTPPTLVAPPDPICEHFSLQTAADAQLTVTGSGFQPSQRVTISLPGVATKVASVRSDSSGAFTIAFTNPEHPSQMSEVVKAADSSASATAHFVSGYATCLTDSTFSSWDGVGWKAGSTVSFRLGTKTLKTAAASANGEFSTSVAITCQATEAGKDVEIYGTVYADKHVVVKSSYDPC